MAVPLRPEEAMGTPEWCSASTGASENYLKGLVQNDGG